MAIVKGDAGEVRRQSLRGSFYIVEHRGQTVMRKWPRARGKKMSERQQAAVDKFKEAALAAKYMDAETQQYAREMSRQTTALPRDMLFAMLYGRIGHYFFEDGTRLYPMASLTDITELLDALGYEVGTIIFRDDETWIGLPPGVADQVLTLDPDKKPIWASPGGGGGQVMTPIDPGTASSSSSASKGIFFTPLVDMKIHAAIPTVNQVNLATYQAQIAAVASLQIVDVLGTSSEWAASGSGFTNQYLPFAAPVELTAGTEYVIVHQRTDGSGTTSSGAYGSGDGTPPGPVETPWGWVRYNHTSLSVNDTASASGNYSPFSVNFLYSI